MILFASFLFFAGVVSCCNPYHRHRIPGPKKKPPPQWGSSYKVDAEIYFPLADVKETATVWNDGISGRTRIDYYGGVARSYYYNSSGSGRLVHISMHPQTTENYLNKMHCYVNVGVRDITDDEEFILLPDMKEYHFVGREKLLGLKTNKWQRMHDNNMTEDTMWIYKKSPRSRPRPLRYQRRALLPDQSMVNLNEYIDYSNYEETEFDEDVFNAIDKPCKIQVIQETDPAQRHFGSFKNKHRIRYDSKEEHDYRLQIFRRNLRNIEAHNRAGRGFRLAVNYLTDRTPEELGFMKGLLRTGPTEGGLPYPYNRFEIDHMSRNMPVDWDWRLHGAVTPVKHQLFCGSCWAFSSVGAVEGALKIHSGKPVERLSEQALIDCSWGPDMETPNRGCTGGVAFTALEWIKEHGLPRYLDYGGYLGVEGFCHIDNITDVVTISDWVRIPPVDEDALRLAIYKHGPVVVSIHASTFAFQFYAEGVFYDETCPNTPMDLDHSVLAVGYGVMQGQRYWLLKNTWGSSWGSQGYVLMAARDNNCGLQHETAYVIME